MLTPYCPKRDPGDSRGHSVVEGEQSAEPFTPAGWADGSDGRGGWGRGLRFRAPAVRSES